MNIKALIDAFLGFIIGAGTGVLPLLMQPAVHSLSDIPQASLLVVLIGAAITSAKTVQSRLGDSGALPPANGSQGGFARVGLLALIAGLSMVFLAGCASFQQNANSEKLLTKYAVMKVIEADKEHAAARAAKIRAIASDAKSIFDTGTATVDALQAAVRERIAPLNLSPSDQVLAEALIQTVVDELQARIGDGLVPADQRYQVSTVLGWVIEATAPYQ